MLRRMKRWVVDHLLWDRSAQRSGFAGRIWAMRRLLLIFAGTAFLTWREWVEHHPPEIVIVAFLHFLFVFLVVAFAVLAGERWGRRTKKANW